MNATQLCFSTFQLNIDNSAFTRNALKNFLIQFPYENTNEDGKKSKKVFMKILEDNFLCISISEGKFLPLSQTVYNREHHKEFPNKRTSNEAEWEGQYYVIYDFSEMVLYISNTKKKKAIEVLLEDFLKDKEKHIEITNIYKNPDEFIESINSIKKIRFTRRPDKQCSIFEDRQNFDPRWALDADLFFIELKYTNRTKSKKSFLDLIKNRQDNIIDNFICIGTDDNNFEKIFKIDQFLKKVYINIDKNELGFYEDDNVFLEFIREISKK